MSGFSNIYLINSFRSHSWSRFLHWTYQISLTNQAAWSTSPHGYSPFCVSPVQLPTAENCQQLTAQKVGCIAAFSIPAIVIAFKSRNWSWFPTTTCITVGNHHCTPTRIDTQEHTHGTDWQREESLSQTVTRSQWMRIRRVAKQLHRRFLNSQCLSLLLHFMIGWLGGRLSISIGKQTIAKMEASGSSRPETTLNWRGGDEQCSRYLTSDTEMYWELSVCRC